jgi:hypothetical protein
MTPEQAMAKLRAFFAKKIDEDPRYRDWPQERKDELLREVIRQGLEHVGKGTRP